MLRTIPDHVVIESEEVQSHHFIDASRYIDQLIVVQTHFHHGLISAKEGLWFRSLSIELVVREVEVLQAWIHVGKHVTFAGPCKRQ